MSMTASLLIKARETGFDRIAAKARNMARGFQPIGKAAAAAGSAINRIDRGAAEKFARIGRGALKMAREFKIAERAAYGLGRGIGWSIRKSGEMLASAAKWGSLAAAGGLIWAGKSMIETASQFEQFQVVLENTEGSAEKARQSMGWVKKFAQETPYELEQVMSAFVALKSYGIDPMDGSLKSLGNAAAGMNKDLMQAIEMMADTQTGEFERLKEFGIRAKKQGEQISFTYMKAGKEVTRTARNSATDINKALTGIFDDRFGGMMERQSKTLSGIWSNIKDAGSGFLLAIADAGAFDSLKDKATALQVKLQGMAADGSLERWASRISNQIESMIDKAWQFATQTDWRGVARDLGDVVRAGGQIISFLASAVRWALSLKRGIEDAAAAWTLMNGTMMGRANAAAYFQQKASTQWNRSAIDKWDRGTGKAAPKAAAPVKNDWLGSMKPRKISSRADVGGQIDLRIKTDRGTTASVERMTAKDKRVPLRVGTVSASV
jgi:phage tail tape-measure protein